MKKLLSLGFEVVFVTARSSRSAELVLSKLGLANIAKAVITRDSTPFRVEQLRRARAVAGEKTVVFVGDTQHDEESAKSLGVEFIRVSGYGELPKTLRNVVDSCTQTPGRRVRVEELGKTQFESGAARCR